MSNWTPVAALLGLLALMVIPAPGIWGVLIGGICVLAIAISAGIWLLDRIVTKMLLRRDRMLAKRRAKQRRAGHAVLGMARKV